MKDILKILSVFKWKIFLVLILLFGQAYCNLALPEYTSNIVDIGIANSGIYSSVPTVIRESEYDFVKSLLTNDEIILLENSYVYIEREDKDKVYKYSILKDEGVYELKETDKLEELESMLIYPLFLSANRDSFDNIDETSIDMLKDNYSESEMLLSQSVIAHILSEYEIIGVDTHKLQMDYIYHTGFIMALISVISLLITGFSVYLSSKISASFSSDLRTKLLKKVVSFESEDLTSFSSSSLITRCTNDVVQVGNLLTVFLRIIIYAPIIGIGAVTKVIGSSMGWVIGVSIFLIFIMMILLFVLVVPKVRIFQDLLDKINLVSREILSGLPVIRAFDNAKHEEKRFDKANSDLTKNGLFVSRAMAIMSPTLTLIMYGISILIVWVGAEKIDIGKMQVGEMIAFITYTMQIITAFLMVSMVLIMLPRCIVSLKRIAEVFNRNINIKEKSKTEEWDSIVKGEIEFKNVYFKYSDSDEYILKNISFKTKKGTTTGIIGSTGSGKSTMLNLIPRFFDVTKGDIFIDGKNVKNVDVKDLRDKIGYVPQKSFLFSGTILSNLEFGTENITPKSLEQALRISKSLDFVNENELRCERPISESGANVSGGERQRLSIARAILKDPEIYIFDDAMSALDYKTEMSLREDLNKTLENKTVLLVSSRISSVMHSDQIIVLDDGEIVGIGTHEYLLKNCEIYKEIKNSQLGGED